ncbi:MAG: triosephosphate isomerase, partial [Gammaproteobacteria bacterium]|nr:triosephosphate isomerase [Gammaproteobacteria bacterium]
MRKKLVAGNWKMHPARREDAHALLVAIKQGVSAFQQVDVVILPSFIHIPLAEQILSDSAAAAASKSSLTWGAQNLYFGEVGAFTGETSGAMLKDYGCSYVLIGHSERRTLFFEDLPLVASKFKAALQYGLQPILCLGETLAQRQKDLTEKVISEQ